MDGVVEKIQNAKLLFIGGAPRSGTTLLSNLLDSHPNMLVFPLEHSVFEQFYRNQNNLEYFTADFISKKNTGQQAILADEHRLKNYAYKIRKEYSNDLLISIDAVAFRKYYLEYIGNSIITLEIIFKALAFALVQSNEYARKKLETLQYVVFKQPFFTEVFAKEAFDIYPEFRFLQILRNPISRYTSAKTRRLYQKNKNGQRLGHINRVNFVLGHVEIDQTSINLAKRNLKDIGEESYKLIYFEELVENSKKNLQSISNWLDLKDENTPTSPTRLGVPAMSGSVFSDKTTLDNTALKRVDQYHKITNWNERQLHLLYLKEWPPTKLSTQNKVFALFYLLFPFKGSSLQHYIFQLVTMYQFVFFKENRLHIKAKKGLVAVSGAT
ncbi:sulfotransferase [Robiginitalea aurantiaca]|uniref:Sulfotransferase n=1 Tax=Robiginitalea aurantiaca TaxID=3056915 RepID=A0ABT7WE31_9FLAO|nr:sulfotransferase [Robiginitalea aurantiaca]MDM9631148.1 sulfotransferase [Robiginitalea aurantiaca]